MKSRAIFTILLLLFFFMAPRANGASAATLSFDPSSVNTSVDSTFDLDIIVKVGTSEVLGVDALVEFDSDKLSVMSITDGTFLDVGQKDYTDDGKLYVAGIVNSPGESVTGEGVLATITFKVKAGGTSTVSFICEIGETGESNISENSTDVPDLIVCSDNGEAIIIVEGGDDGSSDGSSDGTSGGTTTTGGTASELPQSGVFEDLVMVIVAGGVLFAIGFGARFFI